MRTYTLYPMSSPDPREIQSEKRLQLKELQSLVCGYIELVYSGYGIPAGKIAVVNEEGRLNGMTPNPSFPQLVGPVIITDSNNIN